ncbi:hypothetical protein TCAL_15789 [Tigriopus californicus]|uniref:Uncharacterized protein n=1 Tax=Tigriopus californicus TaxID=6832 RepID=A0A553NQJ3_TIGCA|nr:hypothetical protein TCAL_15789 [Tigriopus californicus]
MTSLVVQNRDHREEEEFSEEFSLIRSGMAPLRCAHLRISERSRRLLIQAQDSGQVRKQLKDYENAGHRCPT